MRKNKKQTYFAIAVALSFYMHTVHASVLFLCLCVLVLAMLHRTLYSASFAVILQMVGFIDVDGGHGCHLPSGAAENGTVEGLE